MSRRKRFAAAPHVTYGQLDIRCPDDHPLGAVVVTARGAVHRLERPLHDTLPAAATPVGAGETLMFECAACRNANRRTHYELKYDTLTALLIQAQADTGSERRRIKLS